MRKALVVTMVFVFFVLGALGARAEDLTVTGELVEVSCYTKLGIAKSTGPAHAACAKECAGKGQALAILTDGDGIIKITGAYAENKHAKLIEFIGKQVRATGTSDRYLDYSRAINIAKIVPVARAGTAAK